MIDMKSYQANSYKICGTRKLRENIANMSTMSEYNRQEDDEIDLVELGKVLWRGRLLIFVFIMLSLFASSLYLNFAERKYTVTMVLKSSQETGQAANLAGFGSLATLAGIEVPSGSNADFSAFPLLMKSREVSEAVLGDQDLIKLIYETEWSQEKNEWIEPSKSHFQKILIPLKSLVTGSSNNTYLPPNAARFSDFVEANITSTTDSKLNTLTLSFNSSSPELALKTMVRVVSETDKLFRQRFINAGSTALDFYKVQLSRAQSGEHREALAQLIVKEEQKLMLATRSSSYVVEVLRGPDISRMPTSPKPTLILALSCVLGLFSGAALVLLRSALANHGSSV